MNTTLLKTETAALPKAAAPASRPSAGLRLNPPKGKSRLIIIAVICILAAIGGFFVWKAFHPANESIVSGNGRIEATDIDIAAKIPARIEKIFVKEGELVKAGQLLVQMQTDTLEAQLNEARAQHEMAMHAVNAAQAQVGARESDKAAAIAVVAQRNANFDAAHRRLVRTEQLTQQRVDTPQQLDDDRATERAADAAVKAAQAQVEAAEAATEVARAELVRAKSAVASTEATIARIEADIKDSALKAPRDGRIQYKIAQEREVLSPGGKVLNMVDLADVYMTFFLPENQVGRVNMGTEARIVLDAAPDLVIPANVTFVADVAQFTPKTVETKEERQKLTFRVKAHIPEDLLRKHIEKVKTGLPGVAYVKLDPSATWPAKLAIKLPE